MAHQLIWAIVHGEYADQIDHHNGDKSDNRLDNLRLCDNSGNQHNQGKRKTNTSGYKGVSWHKQSNCWRATIYVNSRQRSLGLYERPEDAYSAYCEAARELHGQFANPGVAPSP